MAISPSVLAELLPPDSGEWEPVAGGDSGASVAYDRGQLDADTSQVKALIDLGRLGTADPYGDIALLLATARETWSDEAMSRRADQEFAEIYGTELDPERQDFYLRLDPLTW